MKRFFQLFANFFQGSVGKILIIANFIICLVIFDWDKFFRYLETPAKINCHIKPISRGGTIDFSMSNSYGLYDYGYNAGAVEILFYFIISTFILCFLVAFLIFTLPSISLTGITLEFLKLIFPLWCLETFDIFYIPIFAIINTFYWLFLGDMIEIAHSAYLKNKPPKKILSIFSD